MLPSERRDRILKRLEEADGPLTAREILDSTDIDQDRCKRSAAIMYVRRTLAQLEAEGLAVHWDEPVIGTKHWKLAGSEALRGRPVRELYNH